MGEYGKMTPFKTAVKWLVWKPLFALFRYVVIPLSTRINDKLNDINHSIVRKSMEGEMPF